VAKVEGAYHLLATDALTKTALPAIKLTGQAVASVSAVVALNASTLLAADEVNHTLVKIDTTSGAVTLFAGTPGSPGNTTATSAAADFKLNGPVGLAMRGTDVYVSDRVNNRIVKVTGDQIGPALGSGALDMKSGALLEARMQQPQAISIGGADKDLLLVLPSKNAVMVADSEKVVALATEATKADNGINLAAGPNGVVHHGANIYIAANGKLKKFTSP
jgi:hypothetical protein